MRNTYEPHEQMITTEQQSRSQLVALISRNMLF